MDVGIRDLKANLSAYLRRVAAGETFTVTDRGHPVAVLTAPVARVDLAAAVAAGWVTPAARRSLGPVRRHPPVGRVLDVLAEDRGE
jgi:prevent-host-death family protein